MPNHSARLAAFGSLVAVAFLVITARLWWIQLTHWSEYYEKAVGNRTEVVPRAAPRGLLYDRKGRVLAENRDVWGLAVVPGKLPAEEVDRERIVGFLASALSSPQDPVSTADVRAALKQVGTSGAAESVPLGELGQDLSFDQVARIEEHQLELPGVVVAAGTRRHYPYGALGGQVLGYARAISQQQFAEMKGLVYPADPHDPTASGTVTAAADTVYGPDGVVGFAGAEALCELDRSGQTPVPMLAGRRGRTVYEVDSTNTPQRLIAERAPVPGAGVYLTLDALAQQVAEKALREALRGRSEGMGAAVVMDARNGDVLVLATEPCLDPNDWVSGFSGAQWRRALKQPGLPLLDKAIAGAYPPGSVFKVISACAALETTKLTTRDTAFCTGKIYVGRRREPFRCWYADKGGHGVVDFQSAIAKSCNIFFYQTVLRFGLDPDVIADYARRFGLGRTTGLGLAGEVAGIVPAPKFSINETGEPWRVGNSLNLVIGQDRLTVTPLQMCAVVAAVANGGRLPTPSLVQRVRWPGWMQRPDTVALGGLSRAVNVRPETLAEVRRGMRLAVTDEHGTAKALRSLPVSSAGKTGSAQHVPGQTTHAWFIAFAPYDEPRYAVCVFVAGGGTGGEVAAPIAKRVLQALVGGYDPADPIFKMARPLDPVTVAQQRRARVAAAEAAEAAGG
jgi:penicillin-binding protein 2